METNNNEPESMIVSFESLEGLTPDEILKVLDTDWGWPLDAVREWFEGLWNTIAGWFYDVGKWFVNTAGSIWDTIHGWITGIWDWIVSINNNIINSVYSAVNNVWTWLQSTAQTIITNISPLISSVLSTVKEYFSSHLTSIQALFNWLWNWMQSSFATVTTAVQSINSWFSNEFIDPFIDWLVKLPGNLWTVFEAMLGRVGTKIETWLTHESPGFPSIIVRWLGYLWNTIKGWFIEIDQGYVSYMRLFDKDFSSRPFWIRALEAAGAAGLTALGAWAVDALAPLIGRVFSYIGSQMSFSTGPFFTWLVTWFKNAGIWIGLYAEQFGKWSAGLLPKIAGWFMANIVGILGSGTILTLQLTGRLEKIIGNYVTPAIVSVFDMFERMGPVSPMPGRDMSQGITKLATFTISGLAGMTLAGEMLSPLKHLGLGHISAIVYDLINYKTLTAAFMGVLAAVYIKTPLTYYYNRIARPTIPSERDLISLAGEYAITKEQFREYMQYHGYPDIWIEAMYELADRPLTPYMLRSLAEAGLLDDNLLDRELHNAGYNEQTIPTIKQMMRNLAASSQTALSTSTAMTLFQEGLDDEATFRQNLLALGVADDMLDRYVFAANLKYYYDYKTDLKNFYIDSYHRRDIEEDELRRDLTSVGIAPDRINVYVQAQSIKRLKAAAAAADPALSIREETIRLQRAKQLITADQEVQSLVTLGKELPYALAIADQDTVKTATVPVTVPAATVPLYETEEGKVRVDTIRRQSRARALSKDDEVNSLLELQMSKSLAVAIADNDQLRLKKETANE